MRVNLLYVLLIFSTQVAVCQNLEKKLLGKWMMNQVIQKGEDVSSEHNPEKNRFFIFKEDGSFESDGAPYGKNTGGFFVNNLNNTLYIDSDQGPHDDSMWIVSLEGGIMTWQGYGIKWAKDFKLVHVRSEE